MFQKPPPSTRQQLSKEDWEELKPRIYSIYIDQNKSLDHVAKVIGSKHGFTPTKRQLTKRIGDWGPSFKKNTNRNDRESLLRTREQGDEGQRIDLPSVRITKSKLERWEKEKELDKEKSVLAHATTLVDSMLSVVSVKNIASLGQDLNLAASLISERSPIIPPIASRALDEVVLMNGGESATPGPSDRIEQTTFSTEKAAGVETSLQSPLNTNHYTPPPTGHVFEDMALLEQLPDGMDFGNMASVFETNGYIPRPPHTHEHNHKHTTRIIEVTYLDSDLWPFNQLSNLDVPGSPTLSRLFATLEIEAIGLPEVNDKFTLSEPTISQPSTVDDGKCVSMKELLAHNHKSNRLHNPRTNRSITKRVQRRSNNGGPFKFHNLEVWFPSGHVYDPNPYNEIWPFPTSNSPQSRKLQTPTSVVVLQKSERELSYKLGKLELARTKTDLDVISTMEHLANTYMSQGKDEKAEHFYKQVLLSRKSTSEEEWINMLPLHFSYTAAITQQYRFQEALERHDVIHQQIIDRLKPNNPLILSSLGVYGLIYEWSSDQVMLERNCRQMVHITMSTFGPKNTRTLQAISSLASSMIHRSEFAESEKLCAIVIQLSQTLASLFSYETLCLAMKKLAWSINRQSRPVEALGLYRSFFAIAKSNLGTEHPVTMQLQIGLGQSLRQNLLQSESEKTLRQSEELHIKLFGLNNRLTLGAILLLGGLLSQMGRYEEGIERLELAFPKSCELVGSMHVESIIGCNELGTSYVKLGIQRQEQGRLQEALTLIKRGSQMFVIGLPTLFKNALWSRIHLGKCCIAIGAKLEESKKVDETIRWFKRGIATYRQCVGPGSERPVWVSCQLGIEHNNLGILFQKKGDLEEATKSYRRGYLAYFNGLGPDNKHTLWSCKEYGNKYAELGTVLETRGDDATKWFKQGFSTHLECLGPCDEKTLGSCVELKDYYMRQARYTDALLLCTSLDEKIRNITGNNNPVLEQIQEWIGGFSTLINEEGYDPGLNDFGFSMMQFENESDSEDYLELDEMENEMDDNLALLLESPNVDD